MNELFKKECRYAIETILLGGLVPFVKFTMENKYGKNWVSTIKPELLKNYYKDYFFKGNDINWEDPLGVLTLVQKQWRDTFSKSFAKSLSFEIQNYISELIGVRGNAFGHTQTDKFSFDYTYRALDSIEKLLSAIPNDRCAQKKAIESATKKGEILAIYVESQSQKDKSLFSWHEICGVMLLQKQRDSLRRKATQVGAEVNVYVALDLLKKEERSRNDGSSKPDKESKEATYEIERTFKHDDFLESLTQRQGINKHIAIAGEAGAGKTTLLATIAEKLHQQGQLTIFISLADLQDKSLYDDIYESWLPRALGLRKGRATEEQKDDLHEQFKLGKVWLLLDGLDEMQSKSSANALVRIESEIGKVVEQSKVVLTCRLNVWDVNLNGLSNFETFRMGEFSQDDVDKFICEWFIKVERPESAPILQAKLKELNRDRIRDMVRHPLRLALLCQAFYLNPNTDLPETKAGLYDRFVPCFYEWNEWKPNIVVEPLLAQDTFRNELHLALGKLAIAGIDGDAGFRLSRSLAVKEMGDFLFKLASDVGWLTLIERDEQEQEVYAFYHASFQEYFAALAIPSWKFFLHHDIYNLENGIYRVFQTQWIETIILWFGNQLKSGNIDIASDFIYALSNFDDLINPERIYSYRAHFIATICVAEIGLCELSETIIEKTVEIYLSYFSANIHEAAKDSLKQTNLYLVKLILEKRINECNDIEEIRCLTSLLLEICPTSSTAISSLVNLVNEYYIEANYFQVWRCIDTLIKTNKENLNSVLSVFYKTIQYFREKGFNDYKIVMSFTTIKNISEIQGYHEKMTIILSEIIMLTQANDRSTHWDGLYALAEINPEMIREEASRWLKFAQELQKENAIYSYVNLLLRASESSLEASIALSKLLDSNDFEIVRKCIEHIVDFNNINHKEIVSTGILSKLVKLASSLICNGDEDLIIYHIAEAFGVIGIADQQVIQTLENIIEKIHPEHSDWGSSQAAISLNKLGYDISKYESFFEDKLISYPPNIFHIYISTQASIARVLKIINPNNLLATEILLEDVFTHICFSTYSWYSYEYLVETIPYSSIEVLSFIVSFLHNNGKNTLKKEKLHSDLYEFEQRYHGLIWLCAQNMSYPEFYEAWNYQPTSTHPEIADTIPSNNTNKIQTLESQLIDFDAIQKELDRNTDHPEIRCLVIDIRNLEQESDPNVIAKKLTNKIFNSIGRRIPVVQDVSCLERELLNLKLEPSFENLAIALYGKSANEAIAQLCQSLTESIQMRPFTGEKTSEQLTNEVKAWLRRINLEYN